MVEMYAMALDCGHRSWVSSFASAGIDWCPTCGGYVGVIVMRVDDEMSTPRGNRGGGGRAG